MVLRLVEGVGRGRISEVSVSRDSSFSMERCVLGGDVSAVSLGDVLALQGQPVCEEQAWAICYQLCSLLEPTFSSDPGESLGPGRNYRLPGPEGIFISEDGNLSLRTDSSQTGEQFVLNTEAQVSSSSSSRMLKENTTKISKFLHHSDAKTVDYVGRLMYSCLDWGLGADVERELGKTLELLVSQMTNRDVGLGAEHCLQPICTIMEVLQVCEERLYNPKQAAQHYRSVCSTLYSHTIELCRYLQIIQQTKENLQKISLDLGTSLVPNTTNWNIAPEFVWKDLIEELSRGVVLRPLKTKPSTSTPRPVDTSPISQVLKDIQLRRCTLRKVEVGRNGQSEPDPHQELLDVIRSGPKLRPVSERNLKPRVQTPKQEPSLHELLMQEIRSADRMKLLSSCKTRRSYKVENGCTPLKCLRSVYEDSSNREASFFLTPSPSPSQQGVPSQGRTCKDGSPAQKDGFTGCRLSRSKRRTTSFVSNQELHQLSLKNKPSVPLTIGDVIKSHYSSVGKLKGESCDTYQNWRVCSCCMNRSLYFTWHNFCSLCSRVVCPECCVEMRLPFKWCINLPLGFFKKIVLDKESEQSRRQFWKERWSWDPSWVPLVLEARLPSSMYLHSLAMRDWHSQEVCVGCRGLLLEACDTVHSHCPITDPQEI